MSWRALLVIASTVSTTRACVPRCRFDGADPPDCVVYGQLGDGELIAFHRASQDCRGRAVLSRRSASRLQSRHRRGDFTTIRIAAASQAAAS